MKEIDTKLTKVNKQLAYSSAFLVWIACYSFVFRNLLPEKITLSKEDLFASVILPTVLTTLLTYFLGNQFFHYLEYLEKRDNERIKALFKQTTDEEEKN